MGSPVFPRRPKSHQGEQDQRPPEQARISQHVVQVPEHLVLVVIHDDSVHGDLNWPDQ
jgi:hypothetical protein